MATGASVRELKNQTTSLLRQVEQGTRIIVTRRGKPIATLKPFEESDLHSKEGYPTALYDSLRQHIQEQYPDLSRRTATRVHKDFERISQKAGKAQPFQDWREMDRALKGDLYGLSR